MRQTPILAAPVAVYLLLAALIVPGAEATQGCACRCMQEAAASSVQ